jgi:integrase
MKAFLFQPTRHGKKSDLWSARVRLGGWAKDRTFHFHVSDKRVASQKLEKLRQELEREDAGIISPKVMRDAAQTPIADHLTAFLADHKAKGRADNTVSKYENCIPLLCKRCSWVMVRDVTAQSFASWRTQSGLRPKTLNDLLGAMSCFLHWMERQQLIVANPLKHVGRVSNHSPREFRRALSPADAQRLLDVSPPPRATVYLAMLYTGLRSAELKGLKWEHFDLDSPEPCVRLPSSIAKNRKAKPITLRPELVEALRRFRPELSQPFEWAFRGVVPRVPTFKKDLEAAGIPFEDEHGRRVDLHALRKTFGTMLAVNGVPLRVAMELMRHSESKLTEKVYTDATHLPLRPAMQGLPSFNLAKHDAPNDAPAGDVLRRSVSFSVTVSQNNERVEVSHTDALGHKKASHVALGRLSKMEQAKRLELSTSTLARWCSTN